MIPEKAAIARKSQANAKDCNKEEVVVSEGKYSIWKRCNRYRNHFGYTDSES